MLNLRLCWKKGWRHRFLTGTLNPVDCESQALPDGCIRASLDFWTTRFMFGMAVLARDVSEQTWRTLHQPLHPEDHTHVRDLIRRMLHNFCGGVVSMSAVAHRLPDLRDACLPQSKKFEERRAKTFGAWALLERQHIGSVISEGNEVEFHKRPWRRFSDEARGFLLQLRVPLRSFGVGLLFDGLSHEENTWTHQRARLDISSHEEMSPSAAVEKSKMETSPSFPFRARRTCRYLCSNHSAEANKVQPQHVRKHLSTTLPSKEAQTSRMLHRAWMRMRSQRRQRLVS